MTTRAFSMGEAALRAGVSEQEYLALERAAEERHEYADGEIYAMASGTRAHSLIAGNLHGELRRPAPHPLVARRLPSGLAARAAHRALTAHIGSPHGVASAS
jgi:hypothetical protein